MIELFAAFVFVAVILAIFAGCQWLYDRYIF